jgi:hypothetical protein
MKNEQVELDSAGWDSDPEKEALAAQVRDREQTCTKVQIVGGRGWRHCVESVEVSNHWPPGSSAQPADFVRVGLKKSAGTCIEISLDGAEPKPVDSVALTFRGGSEIHAVIESFALVVRKLSAISELRDP